VPGFIGHRHVEQDPVLSGDHAGRILQHVASPQDTGLHGRVIHVVWIKALQQPGQPGAAAGEVVQRQVGAGHGWRTADGAADAGDVPHVAVLTDGDVVEVAAELRGVHTARSVVVAVQPLGIGPFQGHQVALAKISGRAVERVRQEVATAVVLEHRVAHVVTGAAEGRFLVELRCEDRVGPVSVGEGTAPMLPVRVEDIHGITELGGCIVQGVDDGRIHRGVSRGVDRVDHPVALATEHAGEVIVLELAAVGGHRAPGHPAPGGMAAQTEVA